MNANLMTKKIEMTKSEAKEAGKLNTEKFHELRQFMAAYPGYEVQIKAPSKRKVELRGLDYKYMRTYILSHDDEQHSKITFKYLKYSVSDMSKQVERRRGARYTISPFQLLINDGNYYLLAFDDYSKEMRTYRVDRMKDIRFTGEPRDGDEEFKQIDLKTYTKRVFSMYGGEQKLVEIRFINPLLDAVVDRFGTKDVQYAKVDETHFSVTAKVEISDQFFGWILGFGKKAKILYPDAVLDQFRAYMDKIREMY